MSDGTVGLLILAVGAQLALQAPINSALGRYVGRLAASLVSFVVGTIALLLLLAVSGDFGSLSGLGGVPAYQLLGGLIGATYVATSTLTVARIGAGAVVAATITGQLVSSLVIDDLGLVGVDPVSLDGVRVLGAMLLIVGTLLVVGRESSRGSGRSRPGDLPAVAAVLVAGLLVGLQHPLNGLLSDSTGEIPAGLVNFAVGTLFLLVVAVASGRVAGLSGIRQAPAWQFLGGLIGVITVVAALSAVSAIGAAGLTAALVTGQLLGSIAIDRAGAFGLELRLITARRATGGVLLLAGTAMCLA